MTGQANLHDVTTRGKRIKTARHTKGLTQHTLGIAIDSQAFEVSRWENDRHRPSDAKLAQIAEVGPRPERDRLAAQRAAQSATLRSCLGVHRRRVGTGGQVLSPTSANACTTSRSWPHALHRYS